MTTDQPQMETVFVAAGQLPAEVIKGKLEMAGIPVLLRYESLGLVYGLTVDGLGEVKVQVPKEMADEARRLLEEPPEGDMQDEGDDLGEIGGFHAPDESEQS